MAIYIFKRILLMIPTLILVSMIAFAIIQAPPGDFLTTLMSGEAGETVDVVQIEAMRARYGLDQPIWVQYWKWISGIVFHGDFGESFEWKRPVNELIWDRFGLTVLISSITLVFIWVVSIPIGIYSATNKYSAGDYVFTVFGFIGLAIPNFLLALVLMYISFQYFGQSVGGLFSPAFVQAPWSFARVGDLLAHLWLPVIIIGTAGTASLIRIMRANLLDELPKPYVEAARARGLSEFRIRVKYPVRIALNPLVSALAWVFPALVSGDAITSIVLNLQTTGPLLYRALQSQDMYLAGSLILILSVLTVIGTLLSDLLLAWLDPRLRAEV
ncbi:ABC transporter permease [Oceaniglobus trochenteri]|uniref:ABC transporter permease n=1 Tax=Oceaniglobus trochenteri TaxID=2763260 RepID=UPI001CFFC7B5|nr:ABC transporter permease [Oceaniglobus trochenteri]